MPHRRRSSSGRLAPALASLVLSLAACGGSSDAPPAATEPPPGLAEGFHVGFAERRLDFPLGIGMAGYAGRYEGLVGFFSGGAPTPPEGDARPRPWSLKVPPSIGVHTTPTTAAVALTLVRDGVEERVVVVRNDMIVSPRALTERVVEKVRARTGLDLSQQLFLTASHTHASGGRFWNNFLFASFGGLDTYSPQIFERITDSIADVTVAALADREPAVMGMAVERGFDSDDRVYHDRRHVNDDEDFLTNDEPTRADPRTGKLLGDGLPDGWIKDDRLTVFRFDRVDGSTKVVLAHFPVHGTSLTQRNQLLSRDVTGFVEIEASDRLGVPVVHIQGAAGDIQPSEESLQLSLPPSEGALFGAEAYPGMERMGRLAAGPIVRLARSIDELGAPTRLRSAIVTFRQDRQLIGYGRAVPPYDRFDAPFGAIGCGLVADLLGGLPFELPASLTSPFVCLSRPATLDNPFLEGVLAEAVLPILTDDLGIDSRTDDVFEDIVLGLNPVGGPYTEFTLLFFLRLGLFGFDAVPVTVPGRGASLRDPTFLAVPGEPTTPWSFETRHRLANALAGRSFDDVWVMGYTADHQGYLLNKEDWITGGAVEIQINPWGPLWGDYVRDIAVRTAQTVFEDGPLDLGPQVPEENPVPFQGPTATTSRRVGIVTPPGDARRFGTVSTSFLGGDPVVDLPSVTVERVNGDGTTEPLRTAGGRIVDERGIETVLVYEYDEDAPADPHLWSFHWQIAEDEPVGRFRFVVRGLNHEAGPYELATPAFEVRPSNAITVEEARARRDGVELALAYPRVRDDLSTLFPELFRDLPDRPSSGSAELRVRLDGAVVASVTVPVSASGRAMLPVVLAPGRYAVEASVEDAHGNRGDARVEDLLVD